MQVKPKVHVHVLPPLAAVITVQEANRQSLVSYFDLPNQTPSPSEPASFRAGWD